MLREYSGDKSKQIFPGSPGTSGSDAARARTILCITVGGALTSVAGKIGCTPETLRKWVQRTEVDNGRRPGRTTSELEELKALKRENRELKGPASYSTKNLARLVISGCCDRSLRP